MNQFGLNTILSSPSAASVNKNPGKIGGAAKQFEALLIEQMLRSARESGSGRLVRERRGSDEFDDVRDG
jgi:hypothetical protein